MSEKQKTLPIASKVTSEVKAKFEAQCQERGTNSSAAIKEMIEKSLQGTPTLVEVVRQEIAVAAVLLLSAMGRAKSTAEAITLVKTAYLSGELSKEVLS